MKKYYATLFVFLATALFFACTLFADSEKPEDYAGWVESAEYKSAFLEKKLKLSFFPLADNPIFKEFLPGEVIAWQLGNSCDCYAGSKAKIVYMSGGTKAHVSVIARTGFGNANDHTQLDLIELAPSEYVWIGSAYEEKAEQKGTTLFLRLDKLYESGKAIFSIGVR